MLLNTIKQYQIEVLGKIKMSLNHMWYLENWISGVQVEGKEMKLLRELGYIKDGQVTPLGLNMYNGWVNMEEPVQVKKKVKIQEPMMEKDEEWSKFWKVWPATKSVPGTQYVSGAKMKSSEVKMRAKWANVVYNNKRISLENMQYAAECYLQWAYTDSKRLGRNELQYRNNMEVWLNQEQYLIYSTMEMPEQPKEKLVYANSTDQ